MDLASALSTGMFADVDESPLDHEPLAARWLHMSGDHGSGIRREGAGISVLDLLSRAGRPLAGGHVPSRAPCLAKGCVRLRPRTAWAGVWQCGARGQEARRGVTVPSPPLLCSGEWQRGYPARVAAGGAWAELRDIDDALAAADRFVGAVLDGRVQAGTWGPLRR